MKKTNHLSLLLMLMVLASSAIQAATPIESLVTKAQESYNAGSFPDAFALLSQANFDNTDTGAKGVVSNALSNIGMAEYGIKNFKNAWDCFKLALKLKPTNQDATTYFLRIKKEKDPNNLKNEAPPRSAAISTQTDNQGKESGTTGANSPTTATNSGDQEKNAAELKIILTQLQAAQESLSAAQSTVQSTRGETESLRDQLKAQSSLVEKMLDAQTQRIQPNQQTNPQDTKVIQQTLQLLAAMEKRQSLPQPAQEESTQTINLIMKSLDEKLDAVGKTQQEFPWIYVILGIILLILSGLISVIVVAMVRARRNVARDTGGKEPIAYPVNPGIRGMGQIGQPERTIPLLGYTSSSSTALATKQDLDLRSSLLKAERLQKMYEDVRNGTLSWETIRLYIDELDTGIKSEILKIVEQKLDTGDLVSNEAVLPIIFPFLNDYDDFLRHKAENIAKIALVEKNDSVGEDGIVDPFSVKNLMVIPEQLIKTLKGRDRSLITANLSRAIAKNIGLSTEDCQNIYKGALAHDAGYLMLDNAELSRLLGKAEISDEEFDVIKSHAVKGTQYFGDSAVPDYLRDALAYHHERKDGSGYPNGLAGAEIPLIAQIIGVAETFASLVSDRTHRDKLEVSHALAIMKDGARSKFERPLIEALVKIVSQNGGY